MYQMSKEELIEFMIKKGNERKRDQCELTKALTSDAQDGIGSVIESITESEKHKQNKLEFI